MKSFDLARIAVRTLALYFLVVGISNISEIVPVFFNMDWKGSALMLVASSFLAWLLAASLLWICTERIADCMVGSLDTEKEDSIQICDLWVFGVALAGLLTVCDALPDVVQVVSLAYSSSSLSAHPLMDGSQQAFLMAAITRMVIGLGLMLGRSTIATILKRGRNYS